MYLKSLKNYFCLIVIFLFSTPIFAQDVVESMDEVAVQGGENMFVETIKLISSSRRIFILSNGNEMLGKGDFITMSLENKPCARALVAKERERLVGIKVLKIYSLNCWAKIKKDLDVQILRGDDSHLFAKKGTPKSDGKKTKQKIDDEEDLYDTTSSDELAFDEMGNRHIKPDNVISASWGKRNLEDINGEKFSQDEFTGQWGYQIMDNVWAEGSLGFCKAKNFPANGATALITNTELRMKYTIKLPLYTFALPYLGYQSFSVNCPSCGKVQNNDVQNKAELAKVDDMKKSKIIYGVTFLHRLVPGWFVKADLGVDMYNLGFAIEF